MRVTIDELEAERGDIDPFEIDLGGELIVSLPHPQDLPVDRLIDYDPNSPASVLRTLLGDDDFDDLVALADDDGHKRVTIGILESILERYYKHFGLTNPGELRASSRLSRTSAARSRQTSGARQRD